MPAGDRDARLRAHRLAACENTADHRHRQLLERHADDGEREDRPRAHRVDVGEGMGGRDTPEVVRVVDDRREEIGGGDERLAVVQAVDRGVVGGFRADEQLLRQSSNRRRSENFSQHRGRDLAAAAAAVAELGQANLLWSIHGVRILRVKPSVPVSASLFTQFDSIVDARSPAEYAEAHIPGAVSAPVLDDAERATFGTLYKQVSQFDARKLGAALLAKNVARHVETLFRGKDSHWRPLVYCWRGGQRSGAMAHMLREIGWDAKTLEGGYRAYRKWVVAQLEGLASPCILLDTDLETRVTLLLEEYRHFLEDTSTLNTQLDCLVGLHGRERIAEWKALAARGAWREFVERLLVEHYDPAYRRSSLHNFTLLHEAEKVRIAA